MSVDSLKGKLLSSKEDTLKVNLLLQISKSYFNTEPQSSILYAQQAKDLATTLNFQKGLALAYKNIGIAYFQQSKFIEALENWNKSLEVFEKLGDKIGISNMQSNIGGIYQYQGNDSKALEYLFNSLRNAEEAGDQFRIASALVNIGSVYQHKVPTHNKALEYYLKALPLNEKLENDDLIGTTAVNIGEIYLENNKPDSALPYLAKAEQAFGSTVDISYALNDIGRAYVQKGEYATALMYHQQAYDSAMAMNSTLYMTKSLQSLANAHDSTGNYKRALEVHLKARGLAKDINSSYDLKEIYNSLSFDYSKLSDYKNAYKYQELLLSVKDSIYNKENDLKLSTYEFSFEIEKKQGQINLLEKDKALQDLAIQRQKLFKNAVLVGFALVLMIVIILYRNYRNKIKINRVLDTQKAQIESLLLNILPAEVSKELQQKGEATPRFYESVSVLFTDFKGFTTIADSLSPQQVVAELSECFVTFDNIIEKYGLEKIKTIGDAYMCAGGIPIENASHPISMIKAAIEILHYMRHKNLQRTINGEVPWEMRIGIHTGPLVAGVVGRKKYAYDIWGSTVNIASRMESNGEPGQINISMGTYELVKHEFDCTYRGKIYAKNVGEIDMYFVKETWAPASDVVISDEFISKS